MLLKKGGIDNPQPPRYKKTGIRISYMQNGIMHKQGTDLIRLTLPKSHKEYMLSAYGISSSNLYLKNRIFQDIDAIKQIHVYPPADGEARVIVVYEVADAAISGNSMYMPVSGLKKSNNVKVAV